MYKISSWFEDPISFQAFLIWAEGRAETEKEKEFIEDLRQRWAEKLMDAQLSEFQVKELYRLANHQELPHLVVVAEPPVAELD